LTSPKRRSRPCCRGGNLCQPLRRRTISRGPRCSSRATLRG
jgi:hypothetical protein